MNNWKKWDRLLFGLSWVVLGLEVAYVALRFTPARDAVAAFDSAAGWILPVLLAGAVGYLTNWLALWCLFKPYEPHWGGRIQGIVPRQKNEMAVSLGNMVGTKLLNPDALVEELKGEVLAFVEDPRRMSALREWPQGYLLAHEGEIVAFANKAMDKFADSDSMKAKLDGWSGA